MNIDEALDHEAQVDDLKAYTRRLERQLARAKDKQADLVDAMYQAISDGISTINIQPVEAPEPDRRRKHEEYAIVMLSDWQLGKKTDNYDSQICADRIDRLASKVVDITRVQRSDHPVKRCVIFALGDMLEGELIFPGQAWQIDSSLYRQLFDGAEILAGFVRKMAATFEQVDVYCVPGNHGYLGGRSRKDYHPESNADRILYRIAEKITLGDPRIYWEIPDIDYHLAVDLGVNMKWFLRHGQQVRGYNGIPWYGWVRRVWGDAGMAKIWDRYDYDYHAAGHFHTPV